MAGRVLGRHGGIVGFTIGQRKGLDIGGLAEPLYVVRIDAAAKRVIVGPRQALAVDAARLSDFNVIGDAFEGPVTAKVRSLAKPVPARIDGDWLIFDTPEYGVSPGQAAVLYAGTRVIGGGWIEETRATVLAEAA
jgi:tRNA-uridine 2-sulfurtransferase